MENKGKLILSVTFPQLRSGHCPVYCFRYEPPIDTVKDMAERDLIWGAVGHAWILSIEKSVDPDLRKLVTNFRDCSPEYLSTKTASGDMAFAIEGLLGGTSPYIQNVPLVRRVSDKYEVC